MIKNKPTLDQLSLLSSLLSEAMIFLGTLINLNISTVVGFIADVDLKSDFEMTFDFVKKYLPEYKNLMIEDKSLLLADFIFEGKSLLPEPELDGEATLVRLRIIKKINRMQNPVFRAIDNDLYDRFHNLDYRS